MRAGNQRRLWIPGMTITVTALEPIAGTDKQTIRFGKEEGTGTDYFLFALDDFEATRLAHAILELTGEQEATNDDR